MFVYEHNTEGRLVGLHLEDWVPGMFFKDGKRFKLKDDPRKIDTNEPKIQLAAPSKPDVKTNTSQSSTTEQKGVKSISRKKIEPQSSALKAKKRHKCKRKRSFSRKEIVGALEPGAPQRITVNNGQKYLWIQRPKVKKQLRGFCFFDVGMEFSLILHIEGSGKLYVWNSPGVTYNAKTETANFVIEFKEKKEEN